jgi:L-ribulose-5-phosphate 3-epimerase
MNLKIPIGAITDEFTPEIEKALNSMASIGMDRVELRVVWGKNIMDLSTDELDRVKELVAAKKMQVVSIASPLLKCVLPDAPPIDSRFQHDIFASRHTFDDQPRLTEHAFEIARKLGANIVRVFSYWRTVEPEKSFDRVVRALSEMADLARKEGLTVGLENEHACNIATAEETARVLEAVDHPNLKVVWDPANAYISGENPFPDGYKRLPPHRIAHVHAKDCRLQGHSPVWGPLGTQDVDWKGQIAALLEDGYRGCITLETHWGGPHGDKHLASVICGENLKGLVTA